MSRITITIILALAVVLIIGLTKALAAPLYVEIVPGSSDTRELVYICENETLRCYTTDEDLNKIINSREYLEKNNWRLKLFLEPKDELLRKEWTEKAAVSIKKKSVKTYTDPKKITAKDIWAVAGDIYYDDKKLGVVVFDMYDYSTDDPAKILSSWLLSGWRSQDNQKVFSVKGESEYALLFVDINEFIKTEYNKVSKYKKE